MRIKTFQSAKDELHRVSAKAEKAAGRSRKPATLVVTQSPCNQDEGFLIPPLLETWSHIVVVLEGSNPDQIGALAGSVAGYFHRCAIDSDIKCGFSRKFISCCLEACPKEKTMLYSDDEVWIRSALMTIEHLDGCLLDKPIVVSGAEHLADYLIHSLKLRGCQVTQATPTDFDPDRIQQCEALIGAAAKKIGVTAEMARHASPKINCYDIGIGNFSPEAIEFLRENQSEIYRLDNRAALSSTLVGLYQADTLLRETMGRVQIGDIEVVAGGILGGKGAVVVDSIHNPTTVLGIANGSGNLDRIDGSEIQDINAKIVSLLVEPL